MHHPRLSALCQLILGRAGHIDWSGWSDEDWLALVADAADHGVVGLARAALAAEGCPARPPAAARADLQRRWYLQAAETGLLHAEWRRLLDRLPAGCECVALKGLALGRTLYADPSLRPLSDLDLLVRRADLGRLGAALAAAGYGEMPEMAAGINQLAEYHSRFQGGPGGGVALEAHWSLVAGEADWRAPAMDWFWSQTMPWPADERALQLRPAAHLLYLAAHLMLQHGGQQPRLIWCYDLHLLLERHGAELDWPALIKRARAFRWAGALHAALARSRDAFGSPVPEAALAGLAAAISPAERRFLARKRQAVRSQGMDQWLKLATLSWPARLRMVRSLLLPSRTYLAWRYRLRPPWLWPAAYPYHWGRMAAEALATLGRLARRQRGSQRDQS